MLKDYSPSCPILHAQAVSKGKTFTNLIQTARTVTSCAAGRLSQNFRPCASTTELIGI